MKEGAVLPSSAWTWRGRGRFGEVVFTGRGLPPTVKETLADLDLDLEAAYVKQVHSARVRRAVVGCGGEGDALWTDRADLALAIATADCVPVLLASREGVAAAHAGWRGIVAGVATAALESLGGEPGRIEAWVGPAIGVCCYEVGEEVAEKVARASTPRVVERRPGRPCPHLDLQEAVRHQLREAGVESVETLELCTRCNADKLWSYRREGRAAGRNFSFIWASGSTAEGRP